MVQLSVDVDACYRPNRRKLFPRQAALLQQAGCLSTVHLPAVIWIDLFPVAVKFVSMKSRELSKGLVA